MIKSILTSKISYAVVLFATISIAITFTFAPYYRLLIVNGNSMSPAYNDRDIIIVQRVGEQWTPSRYDVVAVNALSGSELILKRVLVMPGETFQIINGQLIINGKVQQPIYGKNLIDYTQPNPITVPDDSVWVIGDNRQITIAGIYKMKDVEGVVYW